MDPAFARLLLHFDSGFADESVGARPITLSGPPTIDTAQKVFGDGSMSKAGSDYVSVPASPDWDLGDGVPWQLSFRAISTAVSGAQTLFACTNVAWGPGWIIYADHALGTLGIGSNASVKAVWSYTWPSGVWLAHRITNDGAGNFRWYINGVLLETAKVVSGIVNVIAPLGVAGKPAEPAVGFNGKMDEVLWEKNSSLVVTTSASYDIETSPYKVSSPPAPPVNPHGMAKLLLHLNSDFSDSSTANRTPTLFGPPTIDTGKKVFGAGSMAVLDQYVSFPASTDWDFGDGVPWQASFRLFSATGRGSAELFFSSQSAHFGAGWMVYSEANYTVIRLASNGSIKAEWPYVFPSDIWTAHRVNYDGVGNFRWYVNGVLLGVRAVTGIVNTVTPLAVGNGIPSTVTGFTGNIDEFKWEKDPSLVITTSETYAVETGAYPDS